MKRVRASELPTGHVEAHIELWNVKLDAELGRTEWRFERALARVARQSVRNAGRREDFDRLKRGLIRLRAHERCMAEYAVAQDWPAVADVLGESGVQFGSTADGTARRGAPMRPPSVETPNWEEELCWRAEEERRAESDGRALGELRRAIDSSWGDASGGVRDAHQEVVRLGVAIGERRAREARAWASGGAERHRLDFVRRFDEVWGFGSLDRALDVARDSGSPLFLERSPATERPPVAVRDRLELGGSLRRFWRAFEASGRDAGKSGGLGSVARALVEELMDIRATERAAWDHRVLHREGVRASGSRVPTVDYDGVRGRG